MTFDKRNQAKGTLARSLGVVRSVVDVYRKYSDCFYRPNAKKSEVTMMRLLTFAIPEINFPF